MKGVRDIDRFLEQWEMNAKALHWGRPVAWRRPCLLLFRQAVSCSVGRYGAAGVPVISSDHGPSFWPVLVAATRTS